MPPVQVSWSDAVRALYEAPLEHFVALRKELAKALRLTGDAKGGERLVALAKPTRTAWALNQVVRRNVAVVQAVFEARDAAVGAQKGGAGGEELRATVRAFRERVADAVQAAKEIAEQAGFELNAVQQRRVAESLQASSAGDSEVRARLLAGELSQDVDVEDPFAGIEAGAGRSHDARAAERPRAEAGAARAKASGSALESREETARANRERARHAREEEERQRAQARLVELDEQAREARKRAHEAHVVARRAQAEADRADRVAVEAQKRLEAARAELQSRATARTIGKTS